MSRFTGFARKWGAAVAVAAGHELAAALLARGADRLLAEARASALHGAGLLRGGA